VREYPYRERLRGQLMLALYRAGRQAEALDVFRATRSVLVDELGIEPSPELRQLHDAILAQDGALLKHDGPAQPAAPVGVAVEGGAGRACESNLPVAATPLIGRERELAELVGLAQSHRLTTLTGPGGTGKTRLAMELAAELGRKKADGVCWVPLTAVTDFRLVTGAIADALGGIEDLATYLSARELLLVLDNFEQVIDAAPDVGALLNSAPRCAALVTSRERLGVAGEQEYPVPPLELDGAVELFTARARQVEPGFEPGSDIRAICERLDRLPLALELAAPRVKILSEEQLLARLEQRLPLLAGGHRGGPDRQSTMRAAIAWSYDLLSEPEQRLFSRLAVFIGSFELEAAEAICDAALDTIQSLIDKSLLRHAENGRLFLLETTREYALEQLLASDEHDEVRARHARWYFALGATAGGHRQAQAESLVRLRRDPGNVDLALAWALDHDVAAGLPLAASVCWAWLGIGRLGEVVEWYRAALENSDALASAERADALTGLGHALAYSDNLELARTALTEALALYREVGDERNEIEVLLRLGVVEFFTRSPKATLGYAERALAISDRLGNREGIARSLHYMGESLRDMGSFERAAELYTRSIEVRRGNGLGSGASATHSLGDLWLDAGDPVRADGYYKEALKLAIDEGDVRLQAYCLAGLACVAARNEDGRAAGRLWTLAGRWEHEVGFRMLGAERVRYERNLPEAFRDGDEYRAGAAEAMDLDLRTATAEIFRGQAAGATPVAHPRGRQAPTDA
jgi:predicted ATPase